MILDEAASLVARDGIAGLSMDQISRNAGISKSLIYNYFDNLTQLLQELLERELKTLRQQQFQAAETAQTFEQLVRGITHQYLSYINARGLIIERLQTEPSISDQHDPTDYDRKTSVDYLSQIVAKNFDLPIELARAATDISFGLPASAGHYLLHSDMTLEQVEDITVTMIIGSVEKLRDEYLTRKKILRR